MSGKLSIGLLGFGEVGRRFADDLSTVRGITLHAYDRQFGAGGDPDHAVRERPHVAAAAGPGELARGRDVIVCAVTAAEDLAATRSIASTLDAGAWVLDLNSVSPETKRACAAIVEDAGGRYVEAALMVPVGPRGVGSAILLGGPHARDFMPLAEQLGFADTRVFSPELGRASATKMCRSVIVKGLEALVAESLLTARHYGVDDQVLDSLDDIAAQRDWRAYARYLLGRSIEHGARRAEEMREVASTVRDAGVEPLMSTACAARQAWAARFSEALGEETLQSMLDVMAGRLEEQ